MNSDVRRAAILSLVTSLLLLAFKLWGFQVTRSQAVFSDALETIVNVVAAALALVVLIYAARPADKNHPYGHGKLEFFSAAFEGGMIAFAAVMIVIESVKSLIRGTEIREIGLGLFVTIAAGIVNAVLGLYLVRSGKRKHSAALEASGKHVLSDFWTSAGVLVGLLLVQLTGLRFFDPLAALLVGLLLGWTGIKLVRSSAGGLLDEEDLEIIASLAELVERERPTGIIQLHYLRVMRNGAYHHIDAHCVVPEYWDVAEAHRKTEEFERRLIHHYSHHGEMHLHVDPCRRAYCAGCDVMECPIRQHPFVRRHRMTLEELTSPTEPVRVPAQP